MRVWFAFAVVLLLGAQTAPALAPIVHRPPSTQGSHLFHPAPDKR